MHETARYTQHLLMATSDSSIAGYRNIAAACHEHGTPVFAQLFHPGREVMEGQDGSMPVAYAPSATCNERLYVMPAPMSGELIAEIVAGYASAAERLMIAGLDGCEIVASHGYLPAQFLNPNVNRRDDEYGGPLENRLRFFKDIVGAMRQRVGSDFIIGVRVSGDEIDATSVGHTETLAICEKIDMECSIDYFSVVAGTSNSLVGAIHIVPPMTLEPGYVAPIAGAIKTVVTKPVLVSGRINQPHAAERILTSGQADLCGMTRALICDPELAAKISEGRTDDIRACIGCNQACIHHFHRGYPISCIQHPETGRELSYGEMPRADFEKNVLVIGGGPGGMKAAAVLAARGHRTTLFEKSSQLGGQARLAQLLPGRSEFGGIITNLSREMNNAGVLVRTSATATAAAIQNMNPDEVVLATGAIPFRPSFEGSETANVLDAWQVLQGVGNVGASAIVAEWRSDWIGMGVAEYLARNGVRVRLCVDGVMAGQALPWYVRDTMVGRLHKLGVEIVLYARLFGIDTDTVYFQHAASGEPIVFEGVDNVVLALGHTSETSLSLELTRRGIRHYMIGDALSPRTAEEAVLEGMKLGFRL